MALHLPVLNLSAIHRGDGRRRMMLFAGARYSAACGIGMTDT